MTYFLQFDENSCVIISSSACANEPRTPFKGNATSKHYSYYFAGAWPCPVQGYEQSTESAVSPVTIHRISIVKPWPTIVVDA